ncbi:MAG: putative lipid II flippase FtsW [Deltaproteobacteria bacterium]|nr:putative lipid II flippase FtsW [Deltaproteobacteria bacterium]MBN2673860.1 putative lipid II flippase FtsW [Deltaproteobacteria bacterium]
MFVAIVTLCIFGLVMVFSASAVEAARKFNNPLYFFMKQVVFAGVGLVSMLVISRIDYGILKKSYVVWTLLGLAFFGVLACKTPLGVTLNGASRWIKAGPITIQPAEALKVCLVLWLSYSLNKKSLKIKSFSVGFLPHLIIPGLLMAGCMLQPDFGTTVVMAILTFSLLFVAGAKLGYILLAGIVATPIVYFLITGSAYRLARIMSFLDPLATRFSTGYQLSQSLFGYASGGVTGRGLGDGLQKLLYLPEAHNDFIGSIIGEELGVIGIWVLLLLYMIVVGRGIVIGWRSRDTFGTYVAFGLSTLFAVQALMNLAVSMGLLPTKGLNLPFVSYGGSALLISMSAAGVLLSVSRGTKYSDEPIEDIPDSEESSGGSGKSHGNRRKTTGTEQG